MADDVVVLIALMMCCSVIGVLWPFVSIALRLLAAAAGLLVRLAGFLVRVVRGVRHELAGLGVGATLPCGQRDREGGAVVPCG